MKRTTHRVRDVLRIAVFKMRIFAGVITLALLAACTAVPVENDPYVGALNITDKGKISVSNGEWNMHYAVDGNPDTWWSADDFAPQWLAVEFYNPYPVNRIELSVAQVNNGPTTHEIWLKNESGVITLKKRFVNVPTADLDTFTIAIDPPQYVYEVRILTRQGQGWVAWREVRIFAPTSFYLKMDLELVNPVQITHAGDGSGRLFVIEKEGRIRIVRDSVLVETPFLDISDRVGETVTEQGLLSIAFPPSYMKRQRFYVSYTDTKGDAVVSRFLTSADPDRADPDSEDVILTMKQEGVNHNVGTLTFGPRDGYLYIASGDGHETRSEYIPQQAQNPGTLLGKILRIDVESGAKPYAIPADNPFVSTPGYAPEIWALGLRNPWGIAFDQQTGDLYIPDAGWHTYEEVNFQPADSGGGENYGWPLWEGNAAIEVEGAVDDPVWPVTVYNSTLGCAIVGGAVHEGQFIYADFCTGKIWSLQRQGQDEWESKLLMTMGVPISSIGADESGNLYAIGLADGNIYMLTALKTKGK